MRTFSSADLALACRLEATEAAHGFALAAGALPGTMDAEPIAGGCAMFAGVGSPLTHALGIGMCGQLPAGEFDRLEGFFRERGSASLIDLCPMADLSVAQEVIQRGYRIIEFNNLMLRPIESGDADHTPPEEFAIVPAGHERHKEWCRTVLQGFGGSVDVPADALEVLEGLPSLGDTLFAERDGAPLGVAASSAHDGIGMLFGDATLMHARSRGIQSALIRHRVASLARQGCEWAMACVIPGSASHRNYERCGFRLFYMRVNVQRDFA